MCLVLSGYSRLKVSFFFFFKQKTAYEIKECDWSSDVCSSDLNSFSCADFRPQERVQQMLRTQIFKRFFAISRRCNVPDQKFIFCREPDAELLAVASHIKNSFANHRSLADHANACRARRKQKRFY